MRWKMNKSMKWSLFKVPVKVEQINEWNLANSPAIFPVIENEILATVQGGSRNFFIGEGSTPPQEVWVRGFIPGKFLKLYFAVGEF